MNNNTCCICLVILLLTGTSILSQNLLNEPTSIIYDAGYNRYLVGNNGDAAIVAVSGDGTQTYLNTTLPDCGGLAIAGAMVFAVSDSVLYLVSATSGGAIPLVTVPGAVSLDDITMDTSNYLYVTDPTADAVYRITKNTWQVDLFAPTTTINPTGIAFDIINNRLVLCSGGEDGNIYSVDLGDSNSYILTSTTFDSMDGLTYDSEGNLYISDWSTNSVYRYDPGFTNPPELIADEITTPGDLCFNPDDDVLAVPGHTTDTLHLIPVQLGQFVKRETGPIVNDNINSFAVCWIDYDNDSYEDLYVGNGGLWAASPNPNYLYHNNGDGTFTQITEGPHVTESRLTWTAAWGDVNNDGNIDVFVSNGGNSLNPLYINNGDGTFYRDLNVDYFVSSNSASMGDFDNDGWLDIYAANDGYQQTEEDQKNLFLKNNGGDFTRITTGDAVTALLPSHGTTWCDYDNDGDRDLYIDNYKFIDNQMFVNNGDGSFTETDMGHMSADGAFSTGSSYGDYDNDGDFDLFVSNGYTPNYNFLYNNNGDGTFTRITEGDIASDFGASLGACWGDYDNDGDIDLFVANADFEQNMTSNFLYENNGDGTFTKVIGGPIEKDAGYSCGAAWCDYDKDGFLDLYIARFAPTSANNLFYENVGNDNNWINIKCIGRYSNRSAIGAKVRAGAIIGGEVVWQMREITCQTGYGSQNSLNAHFGLGDATIIDTLLVEWPSGIRDTLLDITANQYMTVTESVTCGDTNSDIQVNIGDPVFLINFIFKGGPAPKWIEAADPNCDGNVNIGDAVHLINFIFNQGTAPCSPCL